MPIPLGILAVAGAGGGAAGSYELISTQILTTTAASVTFSSIPSTYKHLQIRMNVADGDLGSTKGLFVKFNGDTGTNYRFKRLYGTGSAVATSDSGPGFTYIHFLQAMMGDVDGAFAPQIVDILDYASTAKYKTAKLLGGFNGSSGNNRITLQSALWTSTAALSTILIEPQNTDGTPIFKAASRFSLYGIKG
jgi:hypothetical protein